MQLREYDKGNLIALASWDKSPMTIMGPWVPDYTDRGYQDQSDCKRPQLSRATVVAAMLSV